MEKSKGLQNFAGENNCFLNVGIQILWHLDAFRTHFFQHNNHSHRNAGCIFCALKVVFTQYEYAEGNRIPPTALRESLSATFRGEERFQKGELVTQTSSSSKKKKTHTHTQPSTFPYILSSSSFFFWFLFFSFKDDAAEALEAILSCLHCEIAGNVTADKGGSCCLAHNIFGLTVEEDVVCEQSNCKTVSEPFVATSFIFYTYATALRTAHSRAPGRSFSSLLKQVNSADKRSCANEVRTTFVSLFVVLFVVIPPLLGPHLFLFFSFLFLVSRYSFLFLFFVFLHPSLQRFCKAQCGIVRSLLNLPAVFALGLVWETPDPDYDEIDDTMEIISAQLRLGEIFTNLRSSITYELRGMICYYGKHYNAYIYSRSRRQWLVFDDTAVREIGPNLGDVRDLCRKGRFHPSVLFYELKRDTIPSNFRPEPVSFPHHRRAQPTPAPPPYPGKNPPSTSSSSFLPAPKQSTSVPTPSLIQFPHPPLIQLHSQPQLQPQPPLYAQILPQQSQPQFSQQTTSTIRSQQQQQPQEIKPALTQPQRLEAQLQAQAAQARLRVEAEAKAEAQRKTQGAEKARAEAQRQDIQKKAQLEAQRKAEVEAEAQMQQQQQQQQQQQLQLQLQQQQQLQQAEVQALMYQQFQQQQLLEQQQMLEQQAFQQSFSQTQPIILTTMPTYVQVPTGYATQPQPNWTPLPSVVDDRPNPYDLNLIGPSSSSHASSSSSNYYEPPIPSAPVFTPLPSTLAPSSVPETRKTTSTSNSTSSSSQKKSYSIPSYANIDISDDTLYSRVASGIAKSTSTRSPSTSSSSSKLPPSTTAPRSNHSTMPIPTYGMPHVTATTMNYGHTGGGSGGSEFVSLNKLLGTDSYMPPTPPSLYSPPMMGGTGTGFLPAADWSKLRG
jgi:hypothetical protein